MRLKLVYANDDDSDPPHIQVNHSEAGLPILSVQA